MREIKFRAWDKHEKKMIAPHNGDFIKWHAMSNWKDCLEVMQFTGLTDNNGVEIYEGDRLAYTVFDMNDNDTQFEGVVNYIQTQFIVTQEPDSLNNGEYGIHLGWVHYQDCEIEVIGNIHEKKDLT